MSEIQEARLKFKSAIGKEERRARWIELMQIRRKNREWRRRMECLRALAETACEHGFKLSDPIRIASDE